MREKNNEALKRSGAGSSMETLCANAGEVRKMRCRDWDFEKWVKEECFVRERYKEQSKKINLSKIPIIGKYYKTTLPFRDNYITPFKLRWFRVYRGKSNT